MTATQTGAGVPVGITRDSPSEPFGLWGRAFRPFFIVMSLQGAATVAWWTLVWFGVLPVAHWLTPMIWHGHEMIFGFAAAAVAGFLLTASAVWSGGPPLVGRALIGLVALWVMGRVALAVAGLLPAAWVSAVDVAFLPAVAIAALRTLWGSGQLRNYAVVGLVVVLAGANASIHAESLGLVSGVAQAALRFAVDFVVVLVLVIGGRITPAFTQNALRVRGQPGAVRTWPWLDRLAIGATAGLAVVTVTLGRSPVTGGFALVAGVAVAVRLAGWQSHRTLSDPLLWSLHLGAAWIATGLLLVGVSDLGGPVPATAGLHALTVGGIGGTIMAVVTRVALGHTGRPLELPRGVVWCYGLVHLGALLRVASPFVGGDPQRVLLGLSAVAWAAAFAWFAARYFAILVAPRPDGRPG